jgi:LysR family glycine cleavage system transcriptional activator
VLQPLSGAYVPGPRWSWLLHENCARDPLVMRFCEWLLATLPFEK